jgi:hypothetical protein
MMRYPWFWISKDGFRARILWWRPRLDDLGGSVIVMDGQSL